MFVGCSLNLYRLIEAKNCQEGLSGVNPQAVDNFLQLTCNLSSVHYNYSAMLWSVSGVAFDGICASELDGLDVNTS